MCYICGNINQLLIVPLYTNRLCLCKHQTLCLYVHQRVGMTVLMCTCTGGHDVAHIMSAYTCQYDHTYVCTHVLTLLVSCVQARAGIFAFMCVICACTCGHDCQHAPHSSCVHIFHHACIFFGHQAWAYMAAIRQRLEHAMFWRWPHCYGSEKAGNAKTFRLRQAMSTS
jgi:hypothetical protein